ncbi:alpha-L-fucosidase [Candidatus Sumerlaeota bacterium]|nr:alpha-L-fucosidase [Candidatus Sumerlaeota bacterium]
MIAQDPYQPSWESFQKDYQCPQWFRDAKFGIWAHWGPQCEPGASDWYARHMYMQGSWQYNYHVEHYGHPSEFGFMEVIHRWKADKWEPEKLMELYKRAGAQYFVAMANHHDNLDMYDSQYHAWNTVNVGPKRDIVGIWEKVARAQGLHFGVSNHSAHAWHWLQTAYGYDAEGPKAGVRYDAAALTKEDGKGKWWEGLDPQELYTGPTIKMPDGITSIKEANEWHEANTRPWMEHAPENNPQFTENWYLRCQDLVDKYHPELVYFDNFGLPLGQAGLDITAHYYNASLQWNDGKMEVVVNGKQLQPEQRAGVVEDHERGFCESIMPEPWQTCTCIGNWHYDRGLSERNGYKSVEQVVHMLIDVVSKNGNLLLSVPMRGDGTIDEHEAAFLDGLADWMAINGEAIFGTRPWKLYGEGPTQVRSGMFNEGKTRFSAKDVRFTAKGDALYAFLLGWPEQKTVTIQSLAANSPNLQGVQIAGIELLGHDGALEFNNDEAGLQVQLPESKPCEHAVALKITLAE